jgi:LmbE family N-acetylglucosaminyl deacetylase
MLGRIKRIIKSSVYRALPKTFHSSTRLWLLLDWPDRDPEIFDQFNADPVTVLAPHQDDEVIGPGGTIRRHVLAGAPVSVVLLTDGKYGGYNPDGSLVARRKQESIDAAKIMGTEAPVFLDGPDNSLAETPEIVRKVADLLKQKNAKYVYLPALTDNHRDHWAANRILFAALAQLPEAQIKSLVIRGYEIWSPTMANRVVDITAQADIKRQAIAAFPSQTSIDDYGSAILGLNQYRALKTLHGKGYCEAFMEMSAAEFAKLYSAANLTREPAAGNSKSS